MAKLLPTDSCTNTKSISVSQLSDSLPANGGNGTYSYSNNSSYQRLFAHVEREKIDEEIAEKFEIKKLSSSSSNTIVLADLGCATGSNTFMTMQHIVKSMKRSFQSLCPSSALPEFQVFFNDQVTNDFNTLFQSLPMERDYFAAGVAGSFHHRLFPKASVQFVHSSYAVHWLSRIPEELRDERSLAWNKGHIHYLGAAEAVAAAYAAQFAKDMGDFLRARAEELVEGGIMVIITSGNPDGTSASHLPSGLLYNFLGSTLIDMSKEGLVSEAQVDSFNLPIYITCPSEMRQLVEENGEFSIERMELTDPTTWVKGNIDTQEWVSHVRAAMEGIFTKHFGDNLNIIDQMFQRVIKKLEHHREDINSKLHEKVQLFVVLKRK
ncbi:probable S-adenosylmethionine-dependent methyltransferase At5g38100 [Momordica charantia]|uniref:Probable S-adenosylmethionine-dependent methyltransferase At5g38100 n=1 Tax=Momordica charantia TaxID=3673 RepID=A0A6J1CZK9_MOMCH|nr:probable S-adenosylmethionine-dependent methyltransferase At5g38100 [Momordica charantia]